MRGLSEVELRGLVHMSASPDYEAADGDPLKQCWDACVERGLAVYADDGEWETWTINDLGRLALRVHHAVTSR
jgi:hypothetical protein